MVTVSLYNVVIILEAPFIMYWHLSKWKDNAVWVWTGKNLLHLFIVPWLNYNITTNVVVNMMDVFETKTSEFQEIMKDRKLAELAQL